MAVALQALRQCGHKEVAVELPFDPVCAGRSLRNRCGRAAAAFA